MNKAERVRAALGGKSVDRPPFSIWYHFGNQHASSERTAQAHLEFYDYYDLDFLKVMNDYDYPMPMGLETMESPEDLKRLQPLNIERSPLGHQQETIVDGMGRERQQYSGDVSHQLEATRLVCGDRQLARRFLRSFAMGQTLEGYFLDCWTVYDRLNRLAQRQLGATEWGPLLDHGVSFVLDAWRHYQESGDSELPRALYPRFVRFAAYLLERRGKDGLLPVEGWGVPSVWIDDGFVRPRHKQCAFNLFTAAVLKAARAPLAALAGDAAGEKRFKAAADSLVAATVARFWSGERSLFVGNLPWEDEEGGARLDDRSLATALLFDQCPGDRVQETLATLAEPPASLCASSPAGAHWRMQALARQAGVVPSTLRQL